MLIKRPQVTDIRNGVVLLLALGTGSSLAHAQPADGELPVPIQRILVKPAQVAKELEKVQQGTLIPWPLAKFDARLDQVRKAIQARDVKPRLTHAKYSAELVDAALTQGNGQWLIQHPGATPALLRIDSLNLALAKLRWEQGHDALLGEFDGKALSLLVKHAGAQTCYFDWSSRGVPGDDGLAFSLAVPACPLTTLDLKLPAENWLTAAKNTVLVQGPLDAGSPSHRLWKVHAAGQTRIDLLVRKISDPTGPGPTLFTRVQSVQALERDRITLSYEYQLDILHGSINEVHLETEHTLQPIDVSIKTGEVKRWQWLERVPKNDAKGKQVGTLGILKIEFHQPVQGKLQGLRVRAVAPMPDTKEWTSPTLRVRDAIPRGETLQMEFHADLPVGKWDAGTFQHLGISTDSDGRQTLILADTATAAGASRRPIVALERANVDVHTLEDYAWHLTPRGATLRADIHYQPTRGNLFELRVKLPKAFTKYHLETLDLFPEDLLRGWHLQGDLLIVELKQALVPTKKAQLKMQFRNPLPALRSGARTLAFPDIEPVAATRRSGTVVVRVDPVLQAQLMNSSLPPSAQVIEPAPSSFRFTFRDQRLTASVRVTPRQIQLNMHGKHLVKLDEGQATLQSRWDIEPIVGEPDYLDFQYPATFPLTWKLRADESTLKVHHWERLHPHLLMFGVPTGINAAVLQTMLPAGPCWRFHLTEPLRKKASLTIEASLSPGLPADEWRRRAMQMPNPQPWDRWAGVLANDLLPRTSLTKHWRVPLMSPMQAGDIDHDIAVEAANNPIEKVAARGFHHFAMTAIPSSQSPLPSLSLHGSANAGMGPPELALATRAEKRTASMLETCDEAEVTTFVHRDGRIDYRIRFRLWHGRARTCTLGVPAGVQLAAAKLQDHWLDRVDAQDDPLGQSLTLPVDQNLESARYEIHLRASESNMVVPGLKNVALPAIRWPAPPLSVKSRLCLAKDLMPLHHEALVPIGTPARFAGASAAWRSARSLWTMGRSWWPLGERAERMAILEQQRDAVLLAAAQFRANNARPLYLAEALELFAVQYLKDQCPLVIDQTACRSLGLCSDTPIPPAALTAQATRPFWESLGLVYAASPSGALLTSPGRKQLFAVEGSAAELALDEALGEAIMHGQDSSASFASALHWLRAPESACVSAKTKGFAVAEDMGEFQEMTLWHVSGDEASPMQIMILDPDASGLLGFFAAGLAAVILVFVHRRCTPIACVRVHLVSLTCGLLLAIWMPAAAREFWIAPTIGVQWVAFVWTLALLFSQRGAVAGGGASTISKQVAGAVAVMVGLFSVAFGVSAQPAAPQAYFVWLLEGPTPTVLLTPDLIAKLDEWEKPASPLTQGTVLASAKYVGTVKENIARFDAVYELHAMKDQDTLILPLTGVQLQEQTFLDGAVVYPTVHKNGYAIPVRGKGAHQLRLSFTARVPANNEHFDLRFSIPKVVQNKLTVHWTNPVRAVHCLYCWGEDLRTTNANSAVTKWEGQLGFENFVHLRWTGAEANPDAKVIEVTEAHYWDLRPDALSLHTSFHYTIGKHSLAQLQVALADGLHVRSVEVQAVAQPFAISTSTSIKSWHVTGKAAQRRLVIDFVQPISGSVRLNLEIAPQAILAQQQFSLPLPAPLKAKSVAGLLGYRLDATETRTTPQNLSVQEIKAVEFNQSWKKQNPRSFAPSASRAYHFLRNAQQAGLKLGIQPALHHAEFDLQWKIDLHHADLRGICTITSPFADLTFVEFALDPDMTLADVLGPEVRRWCIRDAILQVWLRSTQKQVTLELVGWKTFPAKIAPLAKRAFTLPKVYPLHMQSLVGQVALHPSSGMQINADRLHQLRPLLGDENVLSVEAVPYEGSFELRAQGKTVQADTLTIIRGTERDVEFTHTVRLNTERGSLPALAVHIKDDTNAALTLDAPGANVQRLKSKTAKTASWSVKYPPGMPQEVYLTFRGRIAGVHLSSITMPSIALAGVPTSSALLLWKDADCMHADTGAKVRQQPALKSVIDSFPAQANFPDVLTWNVAKMPDVIKVALPKSATHTSGRILEARQSVQRDDRNRWLHTLNCWIHTPESTELRLRFPVKLEHLSVLIDQRMRPLRNPAPQEFVLPIPASPAPQQVQLRWTYAAALERLDAPNLAPLVLDWEMPVDVARVLHIPQGMLADDKRTSTEPSFLEQLLDAAQTDSHISAILAPDTMKPEHQSAKHLLARQQHFYACLQQAEYTAKLLPSPAGWLERINTLKEQNIRRANEGGYQRHRDTAEKAKPTASKSAQFSEPAEEGIPLKILPGTGVPQLHSAEAERHDESRSQTYWLLLIAVFLLVITYFRHGISLLSLAAPEIVVALILVYFWYEGISLAGIVVTAMMVAVRCVRVLNAWRRPAVRKPNNATDIAANATSYQQTPPIVPL